MKHFAFWIALGVTTFFLASFVNSTPESAATTNLSVESAVAAPRYPLTVVKVKGRVKYGANRLREGNRITSLSRVKFDSTTNIVKVKDADNRGYFMVPRDYELPAKKACNSTICKPNLLEKASLPGGF